MEKKIEGLQSQLHKQEEIVKEKDQVIIERNKKIQALELQVCLFCIFSCVDLF